MKHQRIAKLRSGDKLFVLLLLFVLLCTLFFNVELAAAEADSSEDIVVESNEVFVRILEDGRVLVDETISFTVFKTTNQLPLFLRNPSEGISQLQVLEYFGADTANAFVPIPPHDETIAQNFSYRSNPTLRETQLTMTLPLTPGSHNLHLSYEWEKGVSKQDVLAIMEGPMSSLPHGEKAKSAEWSIQLPQTIDTDSMQSVAISSTPFIELNKTENSIMFRSQGPLTIENSTSLMLVLPRSGFSTLSDTTNLTPITERLETTQKQVTVFHNRTRMRLYLQPIITFLGVSSFALWLLFAFLRRLPWVRSKRDHSLQIALTPEVYLKILMGRKEGGLDIFSTLLSLMTRRELAWEDEVIVWKHPDRDDFSSFTAWEAYLLQWLFDPSQDPYPVLAVQRLRRETRGLNKHREFLERYKSFQDLVREDFRKLGWVNLILTMFKRACFLLLGLLDVVLAIFLSVYARSFWPLLLLLPGFLLIFSGGKQLTFSKRGYALYREMRVYLNNISSAEDLIANNEPNLTDVETVISALPRAVIFGKAKDFFAGLRKLDRPRFYRTAYALLHVYRSIPLPVWSDGHRNTLPTAEEMAFLQRELSILEEQIAAWDGLFRVSLSS